jgi:hypothetical protein
MRELVDAGDIRFDIKVGIFGAGDGKGGADEIDILIAYLGTDQGGKGFGRAVWPWLPMDSMLAETTGGEGAEEGSERFSTAC